MDNSGIMGMSKLAEITALFRESGKKDTPVAIIQDGTTSKERIGVGTVDTIETVVQELKLTNPSIIVIGEVVKHREQLLNLQLEIAQNA